MNYNIDKNAAYIIESALQEMFQNAKTENGHWLEKKEEIKKDVQLLIRDMQRIQFQEFETK